MLELFKYRLPYKRPFSTAAGTFKFREGLLLRYHDGTIDPVSEVAPLPGFSTESLDDVTRFLTSNRESISAFISSNFTVSQLRKWIRDLSNFPSVQFGLSSLGLSILSIREQESIGSILNRSVAESVKMNAVIGMCDAASFKEQATQYITEGFSVLKCKTTADTGHLPHSLRDISNQFPGVSFRIDANRSWPVVQAERLSSKFQNLPVQYIEEPCQTESIEEFQTVSKSCAFPVAADETIAKYGLKTLFGYTDSIPYIIIKPTLHGSLTDLFATIGSPHHLEDRVIYTTALESAVGTRMIAAAASIAGSKISAHGLNTGSLFKEDIAFEKGLRNGTFYLQPNSKCWFTFQQINQILLTPVR